MMNGGCLFINELNRIPENTQNVLLSALDERILTIPKLKTVSAQPDFMVISTQNPSVHVVSALGEALKNRFVWLEIPYQSESEEILILDKISGIPRKSQFIFSNCCGDYSKLPENTPILTEGLALEQQ